MIFPIVWKLLSSNWNFNKIKIWQPSSIFGETIFQNLLKYPSNNSVENIWLSIEK